MFRIRSGIEPRVGPKPPPLLRLLLALPVLLLAGLPSLSLAQEASRGVARDASPSRVRGMVVDTDSRSPLADVAVTLTPRAGTAGITRLTQRDGRFSFPSLVPGVYEVEVRRLGFSPLLDSLVVEEGSEVELEAEISPEALLLDPVLVTSSRRSALELNGFNQRRRTVTGHFFAREDIEEQRPNVMSDILRRVPSLRIVPLARGQGTAVVGRGGCRPNWFLDGVPLAETMSVDLFMTPNNLEGIEVYGMSSTPPQFSGSRCGTIVMWSRAPERSQAGGSFWKKMLGAAAFVAGVVLLTR